MVFLQMRHVKTEEFRARNSQYELIVYRVLAPDEHRIYVTKGGMGVGDIFFASDDVVQDAKANANLNIVDALIAAAKDDIERNEFGLY